VMTPHTIDTHRPSAFAVTDDVDLVAGRDQCLRRLQSLLGGTVEPVRWVVGGEKTDP
jgi:hypothetical protein